MSNEANPKARDALASIWSLADLPPSALDGIALPDERQCLPSSFHVGVAAQSSIGAAALAAGLVHARRSRKTQQIRLPRHAAELECTGYFKLNGETPKTWEKFSGLYATSDGHVRVHANFAHHRDGVLKLLELGEASHIERDDVSRALTAWTAEAFETAATERGLVVAKVRTFEQWDAHPHARWSRSQPLMRITRIDEAPPMERAPITPADRPLTHLRVLDLTRILAGPVCGRTLAAYGADVMLVNSPNLPNIAAIVDTSRGKRSAHIDLETRDGRNTLENLARDAHVFVQGYRPGAMERLGFSPKRLADLRPGIVYVSLSAYGWGGPWAHRRGFDSLVQSATGFNHAEARAADIDKPKPLPVQILDFASGFLMAFGAQAALLRQAEEGGSWHVEVSLLQTARWLRSLGRLSDAFASSPVDLDASLETFPCTEGELRAMPHAARFETTPAQWVRPSSPPGTSKPVWD